MYNAAEACKKLGINGEQLDAKWGKIDRKTGLIKVGLPRPNRIRHLCCRKDRKLEWPLRSIII